MKAAVLEGIEKLVLRDVPDPEIDDHAAILKVEAVSVCGSDIRIFHHGEPRVTPPSIPGHETAGTVVAIGKHVTRVKLGDRVAIGADVPCGGCRWCRNGLGNNCDINHAIGYQIPGAFAQYMKLPRLVLEQGPVTPFSEKLTFTQAALAEPVACAINGLELCQMSLGKSVAIIGLGAIGCMLIDLARAMGSTNILAIARNDRRIEFAKHYGADVYINSSREDLQQRCREATGGAGPDIVLTACSSVEAHEEAIAMVSRRGFVNLFGGLGRDARPLSVLSNTIHYKECCVTGSHGSVPRQHELAVRLLESGRVRTDPIVTHHFPLDQIHDAFAVIENGQAIKVVLHPNAET